MVALRIGIVGAGTVGGGVVSMLTEGNEDLKKMGIDVQVTRICCRDINKKRDFDIPAGTVLTTDVNDILNDPEINCIVEVVGGLGMAKDLVFRALEAGKHVVTANKALVAAQLAALRDLVAKTPGLCLGYEAAVAGGIPIIKTLQRDFLGDNIRSVCGIMNGTTNFMLTKMAAEGTPYADVLKEAQELGFAETPDPSMDVEGYDARSKLCICAALAYGVVVPEDTVPTTGISKLVPSDFDFATQLKSVVKLLCVGAKDGSSVSVFVSPTIVPMSNMIAGVNGATNIVQIESKALGSTSLIGQGAGRFPTANSIVSDILDIAKESHGAPFPKPQRSDVTVNSDFSSRFLIRSQGCTDAKLQECCQQSGVAVEQVLKSGSDVAVVTSAVSNKQAQAVCAAIPGSLALPML